MCTLEIVDTMSAVYVDEPSLIDGKAKELICKNSGKSMEEVHKMLAMYNQSVVVHQWLAMK